MKQRQQRSTPLTLFCSMILFIGLVTSVSAEEADVFSQPVKPLTTLECAQCHEQVFVDLRDNGGAHRMVCRDCHETFHNAKRNLTWDQRVPACVDCHETPHGEEADMVKCLDCHSNAHAPVASLDIDQLEPLCARCHEQPAAEMTNPSAHADLGCNDCHQEQHGYLPKCIECHEEPHSPFVNSSGCMQCHPVHNVSEMLYGEQIKNSDCAGCHDGPGAELQQGHLAHSLLNCIFCHADEHGNTPDCQTCHDTPHSQEMLKEFDGCNDCHGGPHNLLPGA